MTTAVHVSQLITDVDMRPTRAMVTGNLHRVFRKLGRGQVVLMLNRACTIARFVDCERTIHTMYAEVGRTFDLATIEAMVTERTLAIGVRIIKGKKRAHKVSGISIERVEKPAKKKKRKAA
jgi:hypothetical protein